MKIQALRNKRYQQEARDISFGVGLKEGEKLVCDSCKGELQSGTRWWICSQCRGECRSTFHPSYVGKSREKDIEKAETEDEKFEEGAELWWRKWVAP